MGVNMTSLGERQLGDGGLSLGYKPLSLRHWAALSVPPDQVYVVHGE